MVIWYAVIGLVVAVHVLGIAVGKRERRSQYVADALWSVAVVSACVAAVELQSRTWDGIFIAVGWASAYRMGRQHMGTKNNPSKYDCYANLEPNEPHFVLMGRDPTAPLVVTFWRALKLKMREAGASSITDEKLAEARVCSIEMENWARAQGGNVDAAAEAFEKVILGDRKK